MNWSTPTIVVRAANPDCLDEAYKLAQQAGLAAATVAVADKNSIETNSSTWTLLLQASALSLMRPDGLSVEIDFIHGKATRRSREANFTSQPLARALGLQKLRKLKTCRPSIIDATAGLGTDGWMMASLGGDVRLLEASPVLATMLTHALSTVRSANTNGQTGVNQRTNADTHPENRLRRGQHQFSAVLDR